MKDYKNMSLEESLKYRLNLINEVSAEEKKLHELKSDLQYNTEIIIRLLADHTPWFLHRCPLLLQERDKIKQKEKE